MNKTEANRLLSPGDLWQASKSEVERRRVAARNLLKDAWATVTDPEVVKMIGARHVQVVSDDGTPSTGASVVTVRPFYSTAQHVVQRLQLAECLALGDRVTVGDKRGVVCSVVPDEAASTAMILTPDWGIEGREADQPAITEECPAADVSGLVSGPDPTSYDVVCTTPTLESANGLFVRGARKELPGAPNSVGPHLNFGEFTTVAAFAEPCQPRRDAAGKLVIEDFTSPMVGSDDAVLCDFLGGATLWIWRSVLVDNNILKIPWWDSPSHGRHPALEKIYRPSQVLSLTAAQRAALANDRHAPSLALPPITGTVALPASTESPMNAKLFDLFHPQRGTLVVVNDKYRDHAVQLVARLRNSLGEDIDDVSEDLEIIEGSSESPVGAYEVRACLNLEIESQGNLTLAHCRAAGSSGRARHMLVLGLLQVPNQLAVQEQPRALARAGQAVARGAKGSLVAAKDAVVDAGKRKLGTGAKVLAEGSLVSGHEAVRRGAGAAIGMLTGRDPATVADNPLFQQAFNEASTGGMRFAAGLIERFAPGTAKVVRGAADSLEEGIDRKQATKVLDAAAPMVGRGLQALAQAAVNKFLPALTAPATAGALTPGPASAAPTSSPSDEDDDGEDVAPPKPRRRKPRVSKPKAARGETGGAA